MSDDILLGAHMSTAGGMPRAIERGESIGCTAIQVFVKGNTRWQWPPLKPEDIKQFREGMERKSIRSVIAHAIYLVNLCSDKPEFVRKSIDDMIDEVNRCDVLGIPGVVMHPGAHCGAGCEAGIEAIAHGLNEVFASTPKGTARILLETTAGQGSCLGNQFEELAAIIDGVERKDRLGVCLDTCHVFAAGFDVRTREGYDLMWKDFDRIVGRKMLMAIHLNDSKQPLGSRKDRHEHIGKGQLGLEPFRFIMNDPKLKKIPKVLETDKDDKMTEDQENMATLRSLLAK
ncbi:MAG: deoxyribonuclease IV [Candidatus Sumerlaeaceae bacterium]